MGMCKEIIRESIGKIFNYLKEENIDKEKIKKELYTTLHYMELMEN